MCIYWVYISLIIKIRLIILDIMFFIEVVRKVVENYFKEISVVVFFSVIVLVVKRFR